jgi:hypothetical protein
MSLQLFRTILTAACAAILISACSHAGDPANPPTDFKVTEGDGRAVVTWTMASGVDYWLFYGPGAGVLPSNWTSIFGSASAMNVSSPYVVTGLTNGNTYSFSMDGRTNGGPGGAATPSLWVVPRLAGAEWNVGTPIDATADLRGVTVGSVYVAVGVNGVMYSSTDAKTWTKITSGVASNLYAATYLLGVYTAVGAGGTLLYSTDAVAWTPEPTAATASNNNDLNAVASNGSALRVAVGNAGTIIYSTDGKTWAPATTITPAIPTTVNLYAVAYAPYGTTGTWIAVGSGGTIATSTDGLNWAPATVAYNGVYDDLKGVAYGTSDATTGATSFVAVGANGAVLTSPSAVATSWTPQTLPISVTSLNAVVRGTRFIAVGDAGAVFYSDNAANWTQVVAPHWLTATGATTTAPTDKLNAIVHAPYDYSVVGGGGSNLYAQ